MAKVAASGAVMKGYGLIRDKYGLPKVDDLTKLPPEVWERLSDEDKAHLEAIHGTYTRNRSP